MGLGLGLGFGLGLGLGLGLGSGLGSGLAREAVRLQPQPPVTKRAELEVERAPCWQSGHGVCAPRVYDAPQLGAWLELGLGLGLRLGLGLGLRVGTRVRVRVRSAAWHLRGTLGERPYVPRGPPACMVYAWYMHGVCMAYAWYMPRGPPACMRPWRVHGVCMACVHGMCAWHVCMACAWRVHGTLCAEHAQARACAATRPPRHALASARVSAMRAARYAHAG